MFNKRNIIIGIVILAIVGIIGNQFFSEDEEVSVPIQKPIEDTIERQAPTHDHLSDYITPYTVPEIHTQVADKNQDVVRIIYRARWNLESDPTNQNYIDRNAKMRARYKNSVDEKLLKAITNVALHDYSVGYHAINGWQ